MVGKNAIYEVDDCGGRREISCSFVPQPAPDPRDCLWYSGKGGIERITRSEFRRRERREVRHGFFLVAGVAGAVLAVLAACACLVRFGLP
jgi:hypothetical protein